MNELAHRPDCSKLLTLAKLMVRHGTTSLLVMLLLGCDPGSEGSDETGPIGYLEFEGGVSLIYRDGHRVEVASVLDPNQPPSCGMLTERAYKDLQRTIESLDPSVDYDYELGEEDCAYSDSPAAQIHIEGFVHSPFWCDSFCCRPELAGVPTVYLHVTNNLVGRVLEVDGEPYVAIESEIPCR